MKIEKRVLAELDGVYTVNNINLDGQLHLLAATEKSGKCLLFHPDDWKPSVLWDAPGGCMSVVAVPGREKTIMAIQEFYPIFQSESAGIVYGCAQRESTDIWQVSRVINLPFVHRIEIVCAGGVPHVIAATVCESKDFQDDWSKPGAVYISRIPEDPWDKWTVKPILENIRINHGMHINTLNGDESVFISGEEGLYQILIPCEPEGKWQINHLIDRKISDLYLSDIDGDGVDEILTIEPFHGNNLVVYKYLQRKWEAVYRTDLSFGHVIWAGDIQGRPAIIAGNREQDKELVLFRPKSNDLNEMNSFVIDKGIGPTQISVVKRDGRDLILSANNGIGEVALYEIS